MIEKLQTPMQTNEVVAEIIVGENTLDDVLLQDENK